ncbi:MAG: amidohydrolase [Candidatus Cloacimonadales bacterium]|nr:amidohydrolase [Candidatus Cloacimonadota bacterium]MDD2650060.1 amidohydrolase [Candidatus Cloacimonadota bacterium]MDX9976781.1 amidohydrolase [Candidatus Cloacimonadales bacterium]
MNLYDIRKQLHKMPELAFQEHKTQELILSLFQGNPNLKTHTFNTTGILFEYTVNDGDYFLFRADMDALPIEEKTDCSFISQHHGIMHACGHDIHMTILIGLIQWILQENIKQNILFLFQPAEEGEGGAKAIINTGIFNNFNIKYAFALHVSGAFPTGTIASKSNIIFGIPQEFDIFVKGKSSHVALPQNGKDAILAATQLYQSINQAVTKHFHPLDAVTFHVGWIKGGTMRNALAEDCTMKGTCRTLTKENWTKMNDLIKNTAKHIAHIHDLVIDVEFPNTYDPVINNHELNEILKSICDEKIKYQETQASLTGEDFGFFSTLYPSLLFWLGTDCSENLHSAYFLPDEKSIDIGLEVYKRMLHKLTN